MSNLKQGKITKWFGDKGYGFIINEKGKDIFFHISAVNYKDPKIDDDVEYEESEGKKGLIAINVDKVE